MELWIKDGVVVLSTTSPGVGWVQLTQLASETATGGIKISGDHQLKVFRPDVPQIQSGKRWKLHTFALKSRGEDKQ